MSLLKFLILGVAFNVDILAVSLALGTLGRGRQRLRVVAVFAAFQFVMPLLGLLLGQGLSQRLASQADWLTPAMFAGLGIWSMATALRQHSEHPRLTHRAASWGGLLVLGVGVSTDSLILGFSLGLRGLPPFLLAATLATISVVFTLLGMVLGRHARHNWDRNAELGSGCLLLALALAFWLGWL